MKQDRVKLVVVEPWNDIKLAERIAQDAGAKVRILAPGVGSVKEAGHVSQTWSITTCGRIAEALQ